MATVLVRDIRHLVTMDAKRQERERVDLFIRDGVIATIGPSLTEAADVVVDATDCIVTPGLINTHHHLFQTLTRAVPAGQDAPLFEWLKALYPIWARFGPEEIRLSATLGLAELALSGCTLSTDHLYMFPNGSSLADSIDGAREIGIRFHPTRGSMSIGESDGGLPPDHLTESEPEILRDCIDVVDRFHDPSEGSMLQVGIAPCSPFSVSRELMRDAAELARDKQVMLHTHLAEDDDDIAYSLEKFGCRPGQYAQELGWTGSDVWHAHCVKLDAQEIDLFSKTKTGIAHCPCSNCRLGSGIAPVRQMRDAGVNVGLGVDGSASNDAGSLISEARQAMLLQRLSGAEAMSAREALEIATLGGAKVLQRSDLGSLEVGKRADFALWDINSLPFAGAWDPVAALVLTGPHAPKSVFVEGRPIVEDYHLVKADVRHISQRAAQAVSKIVGP